mgnify:FL=1
MLGTSATVESNTATLWDIRYQRQQALELWRSSDFDWIAQRQDLITNTLEGITEPTTIYYKTTGNGRAMGLISD